MKHNSSNLGIRKPLICAIACYNLLIHWHMIGVCVSLFACVMRKMINRKNPYQAV